MRRIIVTGGNGFIGRAVVPILVAAGHEVHLLLRQRRATPGCIEHEVDLLNDATPAVAAIGADTMLHLAWYAQPGAFWHAPENLDWVAASLRLTRSFAAAGGQRLVGTGTCAEYDWGFLTLHELHTPLAPHSLYGVAKASLYRLLAASARPLGLSFGWARIFFPYGPFERPGRLFSSVVDGIAAGTAVDCSAGWQSRDFMHIQDVAGAIAKLSTSEVTGPVNIAQGEVMRVREFIQHAAKLAGHPELVRFGTRPLQPGEPFYMAADVTRLRREVDFTPSFDISGGLANAVERRLSQSGSVAGKPPGC